MMPHLSIRARLIFLSILLLAILTTSLVLLSRELARDSEALAEEAGYVFIVKNANAANKHFGDLRYWLTDFAETLLSGSQQNAAAAKERLDSDLREIAEVDPVGVAAIGREVDKLNELAQKAADAFSSDDAAAGRALLAQAKQHILSVDEEIEKIVERVEQQAVTRRDASVRQAKFAVNASMAGGLFALIVALSLTAFIVHSIVAPLRQVEQGMTAITRGDLDAPIPLETRDEIGAMVAALRMLRGSLIERDRLEREIRAARDTAESALKNLKAAQANLIQAEKMASLGQLTAGIAHEIKNPLNFVNNFSSLSVELTAELNKVLKSSSLGENVHQEVSELTGMLKDNLEKVVRHGKRADSIVKNMLQHSREGPGEHRPADINAIVDESLNLAYHGARAEKAGFNIALERNLDPSVGMADVYPEEITRVLLNLISNGFYATTKRKAEVGDGFDPTLSAATKNRGDKVEIRIRDNGTGIPNEVKQKIFNPFFTTKPSGEGTGLGLSMSHDIIVKQHGGTIDVYTEPGAFTEFTVILPRNWVSQQSVGEID
jgi:signal transduction histidine kinase